MSKIHPGKIHGGFHISRKEQIKKFLRSALICMLCICLVGCNNILGDGEITIVTAPPVVTPQVNSYDEYGSGEVSRFDIPGVDAFYLLPGIENYPDHMQDFICMDYTNNGYFIYYYCAPSYITEEEISALKDGAIHTAPENPELETESEAEQPINSKIDAMIVMAYKPTTREYKVLDAQAYENNKISPKESEGEDKPKAAASTGVEFYKSPDYEFNMLSHCYGCKVSGSTNYFIFDQRGGSHLYNEKMEEIAYANLGGLLDYKIEELERNIKENYDDDDDISEVISDLDGNKSDKSDMQDAISELSDATKKDYSTGNTKVKDIDLHYLIKSAVMDGTGKIFFSMMIYTGESPWASELLLNRVCCVTNIILDNTSVNVISDNKNYENQAKFYVQRANDGYTMQDIRNGNVGSKDRSGASIDYHDYIDKFPPFYLDKYGENFFVFGSNDYLSFSDFLLNKIFRFYIYTYWHKSSVSIDDPDFIYYFMGYILSRYNKQIKKTPADKRVAMVQDDLDDLGFLPKLYSDFDEAKKIHRSDYPDNPNADIFQSLYFINVYTDDGIYGGDTYKMPKIYPILHEGGATDGLQKVYYAPYEYNSELPVYYEVYDYTQNQEKADEIVNAAMDKICFKQNIILVAPDSFKYVFSEYAKSHSDSESMYADLRTSNPNLKLQPETITQLNDMGITEEILYHAILGEVPVEGTGRTIKSEKKTIKAGSFPISYKLVFPEGSYLSSADLDTVEGTSTTSMYEGVLLFYDIAQADSGAKSIYTSGIRYDREAGLVFEDSGVEGSAIDTGTLEIYDPLAKAKIATLMLITQAGVKFYFPIVDISGTTNENISLKSIAYSADEAHCCFIENDKLLSSTGFTPYTEASSQAAVNNRLTDTESLTEKYLDNKNSVNVSQLDLTLSLNSSRAGTIQSANSFTQISDTELLISAYDTGVSLLRFLNTEDNSYEVLHLQDGSYYQSFLDSRTNIYKVLGFDTQNFVYGSMDLARAKVYDFNFEYQKNAILENALVQKMDQMAIDYIRRLHRTRTTIEEDENGNAASLVNEVVILPFEDDSSEEAEAERKLFEADETTAKAELNKIATNSGLASMELVDEYLIKLRKKVEDQQHALEEIFILTKANKLGSVLDTDPYWVGLQERLQYTSDMGDFKDILAEIVTEPSMIRLLGKSNTTDEETYIKFRETLNYKDEKARRNQALASVNLPAEELDTLTENKKTVKDYEEQYRELDRGKEKEVDPLQEKLNTDGIMADPNSKGSEPDRMKIRQLIIEDIENYYFEANPLEPEKVYAPDGSYVTMVTKEREDAAWEEYLNDLLTRINPDNLSSARDLAVEKFAELTYLASQTLENGVPTGKTLTVSSETQEKMRSEIADNIADCEDIADVEALFFGTQIKNLGNPYGRYYDSFTEWENNSASLSTSERAKLMRSSEWYQKLKVLLLHSKEMINLLTARNQTWEEYIQAVYTGKTGRVLRDDQTGETAGGHTTAASTYAQLVEFLCEGQDVDLDKKKEMVEDLLIGLETISGAETVEEAVMIERMTLPAYEHYMAEYEEFNKRTFDQEYSDQQSKDQTSSDPVTVVSSYEGSIRRKELLKQNFYIQTIGTMKESELVQAYLKESNQTWEGYMAGLPSLARNENITDPAASANKIYETFTPFEPIDEKLRPKASDGTEERPTAYPDEG
jgi:hypothetical protein